LQGCRTAGLQDRRIAGLQDRRIAGPQDRRIAGLQDRRVAGLQDRRVAGPQGCRIAVVFASWQALNFEEFSSEQPFSAPGFLPLQGITTGSRQQKRVQVDTKFLYPFRMGNSYPFSISIFLPKSEQVNLCPLSLQAMF